jgi:hypothetical protein
MHELNSYFFTVFDGYEKPDKKNNRKLAKFLVFLTMEIINVSLLLIEYKKYDSIVTSSLDDLCRLAFLVFNNKEESMSLSTHIEALQAKHEFLEHLIHEETQRPSPDFLVLTDLKKNKLQIKEELRRVAESRQRIETA